MRTFLALRQQGHREAGVISDDNRNLRKCLPFRTHFLRADPFQGFCRDLYSECLDACANVIQPVTARPAFRAGFEFGRQLESKNPSPGTLGTDFGRFGVDLWTALKAVDPSHAARNKTLELLNHWRNAIAHQDFDKKELDGATTVTLTTAKSWRTVCEEVAMGIDGVMHAHLLAILGVAPW
jgi:hypothetical protein